MNRKSKERLIIVSNRLPISVKIDDGKLDIKPSVGGLATGMKSFYKTYDSLWIGWSGITKDELVDVSYEEYMKAHEEESCLPVFIDQEDIEQYYYGFSNKTIWPLFHYFTEYTEFDADQWDSYYRVNKLFAEQIIKQLKPGDKIWIHDYHFLLLPQMIRERFPDVSIGYFLHIPFPSFEVFRILPWRDEIIKGLLGADLVGFHTFDYQRHFISCVRRLLGYDVDFNIINLEDRLVKTETFPMGIDYDRFREAAIDITTQSVKDRSEIQREIDKYFLMEPDRKLIISVDRLDYTKGIPHRILAYERFLQKYPEYIGKVTLVLLSVPSRTTVDKYKELKSEVDELVGRINGDYASINWTPIWYFYRSVPFETLITLYSSSEIALLTPLRDGMNLVAKEYLATKVDKKGVLILSEMAGAAKELSECIIINPNNIEQVADAIRDAFEMPLEDQIKNNTSLQNRLKRYNVEKWAQDFFESLLNVEKQISMTLAKKINKKIEEAIIDKYTHAKKRLFLLDYDGTLVGFKTDPLKATPDEELYSLLDKLADDEKNEVVLVSGRDKETFQLWFEGRNYTLITEHGLWLKEIGGDWEIQTTSKDDWKDTFRSNLEFFVDRTPGSFIEEKSYSLVWHYRKTDPELGIQRARELKEDLTMLVANHDLEILEGNKILEVKVSGINKGKATENRLLNKKYDFILGMGDDWTDEYIFEALPKDAFSIKIGHVNTNAEYMLNDFNASRNLLLKLAGK